MSRSSRDFLTQLSVQDCADVFERAIRKRPLALKLVPLENFTPNRSVYDVGETWDFSVGVKFQAVAVQFTCKAQDGGTYASVTRVGPMFGAAALPLWNHVINVFRQTDPYIGFGDEVEEGDPSSTRAAQAGAGATMPPPPIVQPGPPPPTGPMVGTAQPPPQGAAPPPPAMNGSSPAEAVRAPLLQTEPARHANQYAHACRAVVHTMQAVCEVANDAHGARQVAAQRPQHPSSIQTFERHAAEAENKFIPLYKSFLSACAEAREIAAQFREVCSTENPELDHERVLIQTTGMYEDLYGPTGTAVHILRTEYGSTPAGFMAGLRASNQSIDADIFNFGEEGFMGHVYAPPQQEVPDERACPWCAEMIKTAAIICRFCSRDVAEASSKVNGIGDA